jgi:hypothetical protein
MCFTFFNLLSQIKGNSLHTYDFAHFGRSQFLLAVASTNQIPTKGEE